METLKIVALIIFFENLRVGFSRANLFIFSIILHCSVKMLAKNQTILVSLVLIGQNIHENIHS